MQGFGGGYVTQPPMIGLPLSFPAVSDLINNIRMLKNAMCVTVNISFVSLAYLSGK
jgi:hypothetical protein